MFLLHQGAETVRVAVPESVLVSLVFV